VSRHEQHRGYAPDDGSLMSITCSCYEWSAGGYHRADLEQVHAAHVVEAEAAAANRRARARSDRESSALADTMVPLW